MVIISRDAKVARYASGQTKDSVKPPFPVRRFFFASLAGMINAPTY
jgi:hypothetical protein